jgi:hypothetical protein
MDWYLIRTNYKLQNLQWTWILGLQGDQKHFEFVQDLEFIPDAALIYRSKPNVSKLTDQFGFELPDRETAENTKRKIILALGDSTTWEILSKR